MLSNYPENEGLAYFYCNRNETERQDPRLVLSSFVKQLSTSRTNVAVHNSLVKLYTSKKRVGFPSGKLSIEESQDLLLEITQSYPQTTLVLDALDECDKQTRSKLVATLDALVSQSSTVIKVLISSRADSDIKLRFEGGPNVNIRATDNETDIAKFIDDKIKNSPQYSHSPIELSLEREIHEKLVEKAGGM